MNRSPSSFVGAFEDEKFYAAAERAERHRENKRYHEIIENLDLLDEFLYADERVLRKEAGMSSKQANRIFKRARLYVTELREGSYKGVGQLLEESMLLRDATCARMEALQLAYQSRLREREEVEHHESVERERLERRTERRRLWRKVGYGVGGTAVVSTNIALDLGIIAASFGMLPIPIATSLSQTVGGALIGGALPSE